MSSAVSQTTVIKKEDKQVKMTVKTKLPVKKFENRESLLTDLFQNPHIKTVQHIFIALFLGLLANRLALDSTNFKKSFLGLRLIKLSFDKLHVVLLVWTLQFVCTCLVFVFFHVWARVRLSFNPKTKSRKLWDVGWIATVFFYYVFGFRTTASFVNDFKLPVASAAILTLETTRMLMKVHSFIRENVEKVLLYKEKTDETLSLPKFSSYLYFSFAPTLLYRDEYPRTPSIRWKFVLENLVQIVLIVLTYSVVFENILIPWFEEFGIRKYTIWETITCISQTCIPAMLLKLCTFYLILHCWQNMFSELLRFGDRLFYRDWWTVTTYGEYFRTWNILVGDWLYTYIYKDMYEIVVPRNKLAAKMAVFVVSAVVHEYVLTYMFGFFFPFLFILFLFGGAGLSYATVPKNNLLNILFWYGLSVGTGMLVSMYSFEFMARANNPTLNPSFADFFIPRFFRYIEM